MKLTDGELRDIMRLLQAGKALPDEYRFKLFDSDREVELVWNGKTNDVESAVLPFQTIEHVDEPRTESDSKAQFGLFENEWQDFRIRKKRKLELKTPFKEVTKFGRTKIAVKVVDIFGNDTMKVVEVNV